MLRSHRLVPSLAHLVTQARQLGVPFLPRGAASQLERTSPIHPGDVREPQELERLGAHAPVAFGVLAGESPEPQHPGLVRVQLQAELREA
ncbi:MAG: hypothetical protein IT372_05515 [Polyangiaceae bacterium]|nr:hypothetical protein [Polyangiaceae bacterium]